MDNVIDDLALIVKRCKRAAGLFEKEPVKGLSARVQDALDDLDACCSGSWFGYHAFVYYRDFETPEPGDHFSVEWGLMDAIDGSSGNWIPVKNETIYDYVMHRSGAENLDLLQDVAKEIDGIVGPARRELLATLDAFLSEHKGDEALKEIRQKVAEHEDRLSARKYIEIRNPQHPMSRDSQAITQGLQPPPHIDMEAKLKEQRSYATAARKLGELAEQALLYLQKRMKLKGKSVAKTDGKVFIGHGGSKLWLELRIFLEKKLKLTVDEYNIVSAAGKSRKERLQEMLEDACFAFLVMTAEDQQADGTMRARENVVHEVGLFQGRLGWERAIVLLEDGCNEFTNIEGIGQLRFSKGKILSCAEEIRDVLEREKIKGA